MLKKLIPLILLCASPTAMAHDWNQDDWAISLTRNHTKILECFVHLLDDELIQFRKQCSLHTMAYQENKLMARYHGARDKHPEMDEVDFIISHWESDELAIAIGKHIGARNSLEGIIVGMYVAEGLTRNKKTEQVAQRFTSEINKTPGNDEVHNK